MIRLLYKVECDGCGHNIERTLDIPYVIIIDADNANYFFKFMTPVLPKKWIVVNPKKEGEPDKIYCSHECKNA